MFDPKTPPRTVNLILLAGLSVLSLNMFLPSLPAMAAAFATDYETISLAVAGYLAVTACVQLLAGPVSDLFGRRPVLLAALAVFFVASVGCVLARDIGTFLACRMLQGAVITGWVLSLAVVRDTRPQNQAASLIGYITMAMAVAPMVGPMIGGVLDELFGWRANFMLYAVLGGALLVLCVADFGETNHSHSDTFAAQFRDYPELVGSRRFWGYVICMATATGMFYAFLAGAPLMAASVLDLSAAELGFWMGTITAGFIFGSFLSGRFSTRMGVVPMMIAGRTAASAGLVLGVGLLSAGFVNEIAIFGTTVFAGFGNGLTMPGANAGVMSLRPNLAGSAAGLAGAASVAFGAASTWATGALLNGPNAAISLLAIMFALAAAGLLAALFVGAVNRSEDARAA